MKVNSINSTNHGLSHPRCIGLDFWAHSSLDSALYPSTYRLSPQTPHLQLRLIRVLETNREIWLNCLKSPCKTGGRGNCCWAISVPGPVPGPCTVPPASPLSELPVWQQPAPLGLGGKGQLTPANLTPSRDAASTPHPKSPESSQLPIRAVGRLALKASSAGGTTLLLLSAHVSQVGL